MTHPNSTTRPASSHLTPMQLAKLTVLARDGNPGPLEWVGRLEWVDGDPQFWAVYRDPLGDTTVMVYEDGVSVSGAPPVRGATSAFQHHPYSSLYWAAFGQAG